MPVNGLKAGIQPKDIWWKSVGQTRLGNRLTDTLISRIDAAGREFSWQNDRRRAPSCERIISYLDNLPNVFSKRARQPSAAREADAFVRTEPWIRLSVTGSLFRFSGRGVSAVHFISQLKQIFSFIAEIQRSLI